MQRIASAPLNVSSRINKIGTKSLERFPRNILDLNEVFKQESIAK